MSKFELFKTNDFSDFSLQSAQRAIERNHHIIKQQGSSGAPYPYIHPIDAAERANKKLQEYLESCPVVYGAKQDFSNGWGFDQQGIIKGLTTHTARLAFIEELPKDKPKVSDIKKYVELINKNNDITNEQFIKMTGELIINELINLFKKEGWL